jgi:hypothetical protein
MRFLKFWMVGIALLTWVSCKKTESPTPLDPNNHSGYFKSSPVDIGRGTAFVWVRMKTDGKPHSIGLTLTKGALEYLPTDSMGHDPNMMNNITELQFPKQALETTPFKHAVINWNARGHLPPPYALPHFDLHFYTITSAERYAIPAYSVMPQKFDNLPAYDYFPPNYFTPADTCDCGPIGGNGVLGETAEPQMGYHWIDMTSPELQPGGPKFTQTFIYGSYDGKVNYLEPMITLEFMHNSTFFTRTVPRPAKVQITGYYPTTMTLMKNFGGYELIFGDMEYRVQQ